MFDSFNSESELIQVAAKDLGRKDIIVNVLKQSNELGDDKTVYNDKGKSKSKEPEPKTLNESDN